MARISVALILFFLANIAQAQTFGDGVAAYSLGRYDQAIEIWQALADQDANAQFRLGNLYERGAGVTRDYHAAANWYRKAAARGHADAQNAYARLHEEGRGVDKGPATAWQWRLKAAESGSADAQYHVANAYMTGQKTGQGVERDLVRAYVWFSRAAKSFGPSPEGSFARTAIKSIGAVLTPDDHDMAARLLSEPTEVATLK